MVSLKRTVGNDVPSGTRSRARANHVRALLLMGSLLALLTIATESRSQTAAALPGGKFGFSYPNFAGSTLNPQAFTQTFGALMHNPSAFQAWAASGTDPRRLSPGAPWMKHINIRSLQTSQPSTATEGRTTLAQIQAVNSSWILKDASGNPITLFGIPGEYHLDFGNPAYQDWIVNTWMPTQLFDAADQEIPVTWFMHDVGSFVRNYTNCAPSDAACNRYNTDDGIITAWDTFFAKFKQRWPQKKITLNVGTLTYVPVATQVAGLQRVLAKADGMFSECLTEVDCYWKNESPAGKRTALLATLQIARWLADNGKAYFPNIGIGGDVLTQPQIDYSFAFFNLMRRGDQQYLGWNNPPSWSPRTYPEMSTPLGAPVADAVEFSSNVFRREFQGALAYVNLSDSPVSIPLPSAGAPYRNAQGQTVNSPLNLTPFSGLTVYKARVSSEPSTPTAPVTQTPTPSAPSAPTATTPTPTPTPSAPVSDGSSAPPPTTTSTPFSVRFTAPTTPNLQGLVWVTAAPSRPVAAVSFSLDGGVRVKGRPLADGTWTIGWNTLDTWDGTHTIRCHAAEPDGTLVTGTPMTVIINNQGMGQPVPRWKQTKQ